MTVAPTAKFVRLVDYFASLSNLRREPTELGLRQFFEHQSAGVLPTEPDPFYECLINGKQWFDWSVDEIRKSYLTADWPGWDHYRSTMEPWKFKMFFGWAKPCN